LQACKKNYIVFEGNSLHKLDISAGTAPIRAKYEAMGLQVYDVKISETNGDQPEAWAIEGDELSQAHLVGSAYVEFESSEDGEKARAQEPFYTETIPSRGDAIQAQYFAQEYRDQTTREQQLLALFGNATPRALAISTQEIATALQNIMDKDASFNIVRIIVRVMVDAINLPALVSVKISTRQMKRVVVNLRILDLFRRRAWIKRSIHRLMTQAQDCGHFMLLASSEQAWATRLMWRLIPRQTSLLVYKAMCA
jgi:hypothetical protein